MKIKQIIIAMLLLISTALYSQAEFQIYKVKSGPYNQYTQEYDAEEKPVSMKMILDNSVVRIFDGARSVYITKNYREVQNDYKVLISKWDAVDEKGRNVGIFMSFDKQTKESTLAVVYNDFIFQYYFYE